VVDERDAVTGEMKVQLKDMERKLLDETDGGSCILNKQIKVISVMPSQIVDWKKAQVGLEITDEKLKPYLKDKKGYAKFSLLE